MDKDFALLKVGKIAAKVNNALVGGPFGSNLVSRDYVGWGVPVIRGQNMGHGRWVTGDFVYVTSEKADSLSANLARPGDIVFTQRGTLGQVAIIPERPFDRYLVSQSQMKLTVDESRALPLYLYYVFTSQEQQDHIARNAIQTGVPHTNLGILRDTPVRIPSISKQQHIVDILGTLDDKIELNRRMNETLEAMARRLFRSWFVDFDPIHAKAALRRQYPKLNDAELSRRALPHMAPDIAELFPDGFEDSPFGRIPNEWRTAMINDIAENPRRVIQPSDMAPNTPYIALDHMPRKCIALSEWGDADDVASGKSLFHRGEILFGKLRPYFHKVGVAPIDGVCSTDILVVVPKAQHWFGPLLEYMSSDEMISHTDTSSTGTKMPRTSWSDIARFPIIIPPEKLAAEFTRHVRPAVNRIHANIMESCDLTHVRDKLLPRLMSGRLGFDI